MNPTQPPGLDQLHDIVVPAAVSWWPPAPATWLILAVAAAWLVTAVLAWLRTYRRDAYRRAARSSLDRIRPRLRSADTRPAALRDIVALLKRTALAAFPRERVAMLSGEPWLQFLAKTSGKQDFVGALGKTLVIASYDPNVMVSDTDSARIADLCAHWIANHRVDPSPQALKPSHAKPPSPEARKPLSS